LVYRPHELVTAAEHAPAPLHVRAAVSMAGLADGVPGVQERLPQPWAAP
jgi:hypothetical protein